MTTTRPTFSTITVSANTTTSTTATTACKRGMYDAGSNAIVLAK